MEDDSASWLYSAPLSTLLLCGAAAIFLLGYRPEAEKARECEARVAAARARIVELTRQEKMARRRIGELQEGVPEAIEEAVREVLRYGAINDFLPGAAD
jgi:cell division protein FtsB